MTTANPSPAFVVHKRRKVTLSRISGKAGWVLAQVFLWIFLATVVFPMLWTFMTSFKTSRELFSAPWSLPAEIQWANYARAWDKMHVSTYLFNSIFVSATSLFGIMTLGAMIAYALARYEFPGNRVVYFYFIAAMMIPGFLSLIPAWFLHRSIGTLGTPWGLIIQYTAGSLPFTIFLLQSFFKTLPKELEESAIIDGASLYQVFFLIMLPLAKSGLLTVAVFNFLGVWNEFMWALVTISKDEYKTLPLGMSNLLETAYYATDWGAMFAGFILMLVPTFIVYAIFQNRLAEGITVGALKG
ncbi:MAG: carbohydrate ABC transporter permease [Chloroflexi bacterium]|nr:carbohydrate ABC transporter permease [Chloroflexota bacterium]